MSKQEGINAISKTMAALSVHLSETVLKHIHGLTNYEQVIGIMGKTGVGKTACARFVCCGIMDIRKVRLYVNNPQSGDSQR